MMLRYSTPSISEALNGLLDNTQELLMQWCNVLVNIFSCLVLAHVAVLLVWFERCSDDEVYRTTPSIFAEALSELADNSFRFSDEQ